MQIRDPRHAMLPQTSAEQRSRQQAIVTLRRLLNAHVRSKNIDVFETEGKPAFVREHGRAPQSAQELEAAFHMSPGYRRWSAIMRATQEILWLEVGEPIFADLDRMRETARSLTSAPDRKGTLELDPSYTPSREVADTDIHLQPGGYALDLGNDDVAAGALYENGGNIYAFGQGFTSYDSKAGVILGMLETQFDGFRPKRILDIGCSAGTASVTYATSFPDAEVHAIDIGPAMLRYAHARAEAMGAAVHFHQMDGRALRFDDDSFDLVVSNNLMHEISNATRAQIFRESWRVARKGGVVIHQDVGILRRQNTLLAQVEKNWDHEYNGEPHWWAYATGDTVADMLAAGFPKEAIDERFIDAVGGESRRWYTVSARKPQ